MKLNNIFSPAIWLMRQLNFATKLRLMALALLTPLLAVLVQLTLVQIQDTHAIRTELDGIGLVGDVSDLIRQLQNHRGLNNMVLSGNAAAQSERDQSREALRQAFDALNRKLVSTPTVMNPQEWSGLRARVEGLVAALDGKTAPASFAIHSELIEDLTRFVYGIGKQSNLLFDPDPASYMLIDTVVSRTTAWTEQLGKLQGLGAGLLSQPTLDEAGAVRIRTQLDSLALLIRDDQYGLALMKDFGVSDPMADKALQASTTFLALAQERFAPGAATGQPQAFFAAGAQTMETVTSYQRSAISQATRLLAQRLDKVRQMFWLTIGGSGLCVFIMLYFLLAFQISFVADLRQVLAFMQQTAGGNLRLQVHIDGKDELSAMASAMSTMVKNLSAMVASVRSNSALVSYAGSSLAQGNRALSERTEQQAANLEQTAASVEELSSTVQDNAHAAQQSAAMAGGVRDVAEHGAQDMTEAIGSVEAIQGSTKRMDEIVGVIDGLAFQTNILALNAAVEAARAGESGRGFAVVASEVRSLAKRSAESAKEIRLLISTSSAQVATGVAQIRTAGVNLTQIVEGIRGVAANMSQISTSSAEQSSGLTEITTAVRQLDEITQQNASVVERAVSQANDLEVRASTLADAVSGFQLMQGTAEEAMALVERAISYRRQCSSRETYLRDLTQADKSFFDRDMYVFALDLHGTYLAFGGNQAKVGTRVQDIPGIDGEGLVADIIAQAQLEPGWVEYDINNPTTGRVQAKMSFVQQLDDLYIGCGIYKNLVAS